MIDTAAIKGRATVPSVLAAHGCSVAKRGPCPLHAGDNRTAFLCDDEHWACWTHCGSGDVISLVELLRGVRFIDAVRWLEGFVGLRADDRPVVHDEFPDLAPLARAAWLADIDERFEKSRRFNPSSPWLDDLQDEWREASRMPGGCSIRPVLREVVEILRGEP